MRNDGYSQSNERRNERNRRNDRKLGKNERHNFDRNDKNDKNHKNNRNKNEHRSEKNNHKRELKENQNKRLSQKEQVSIQKNHKNNHQKEVQKEIQRLIQKEQVENENAIKAFRTNVKICEICGQVLKFDELNSALSNKATGNPAHFDCVFKQISETEKMNQNERLTYIGQGRFGILHFDNPHDLRHFTISRIIEWENRDNRLEWRNEIAGLFSQVK